MRFLALALLGGCTWVYDAQYDDRRKELEEQRSEFLPAENNVQFINGAGDKVFWVDVVKPLDQPTLHSFSPATNQTVDYMWSIDMMIDEDVHYGAQIIADCSFGSVYEAYDANAPNTVIATTGAGSTSCSVDGNKVYFLQGRELLAWTPGAGEPVVAVNLDTAGVGESSIGGFAVDGNSLLIEEGGDIWLVDITAARGEWLENPASVAAGTVVFDQTGVIYQTSQGVLHTTFAGHETFNLGDAIADGGYHLSFKHPDIQTLDTASSTVELALQGRHVIYRARSGIFAFGLDSKKVTDILLNTAATDFGSRPIYRHPVVTSDGTLFVMDDANVSQGEKPIYRVPLADRLF